MSHPPHLQTLAAEVLTSQMAVSVSGMQAEAGKNIREVSGLDLQLVPDTEHILTARPNISNIQSLEWYDQIVDAYTRLEKLKDLSDELMNDSRSRKLKYLLWVANGTLGDLSLKIHNQEFADLEVDLLSDEDIVTVDKINSENSENSEIIKAMFTALSNKSSYFFSKPPAQITGGQEKHMVLGLGKWDDKYMDQADDIQRWFWADRRPDRHEMRERLGLTELFPSGRPRWVSP